MEPPAPPPIVMMPTDPDSPVPQSAPAGQPSAPPGGVRGTRPVVAVLSVALAYLVLYTPVLALLYVGPSVGPGMGSEHAAIRASLVRPFSDRQSDFGFLPTDEQAHMRDVGRIFDVANLFGVLALGTLIGATVALRRRGRRLRPIMAAATWCAAVSALALLVVVGLGAWVSFDRFWDVFHRVLFPQGGWRFAFDSVLIRTYPTTYFQAFVLRWVIVVVAVSVLMAVLARRALRAEEEGR
jgi:hypothetical protein